MVELKQSDNKLRELIRMGYVDSKGVPTKNAENVSPILKYNLF
jgi:hypothetical protein